MIVHARGSGIGTLVGATGFLGVIVTLDLLQPTYDFRRQLISELVYGAGGRWLVAAFALLAASVFLAARGLRSGGASRLVQVLMHGAALGFLAAGIWTLRDAPLLHVSAVAFAFVSLVSSMALLPRTPHIAHIISPSTSWLLAGVATLSVGMADTLLPLAIAQRITAATTLLWLIIVGWNLTRMTTAQMRPNPDHRLRDSFSPIERPALQMYNRDHSHVIRVRLVRYGVAIKSLQETPTDGYFEPGGTRPH
ncbi:MAG TPA: DUF998 domain-containing protein [Polyangiaceae bacterium]|nr:DUF998 domain-containing protein [Polyangiaceae bacterium]